MKKGTKNCLKFHPKKYHQKGQKSTPKEKRNKDISFGAKFYISSTKKTSTLITPPWARLGYGTYETLRRDPFFPHAERLQMRSKKTQARGVSKGRQAEAEIIVMKKSAFVIFLKFVDIRESWSNA